MSTSTAQAPDSRTRALGDTESLGTWAIVRRGLALSPELGRGFSVTLGLALLATLGQVLVPIAVQQTTDRGILAKGGPDSGLVLRLVLLVAVAVLLTSVASYAVNLRLFRSSESGLATLRIRGFRQIHDLSMLTQNAERRGSLVSRVTSDVDQISEFVQSSGLTLIVSSSQILIATALMLFYSPELTGVVWICFVPLFLLLRRFQAWSDVPTSRCASGSATCSARSRSPWWAPRRSARTASRTAPPSASTWPSTRTAVPPSPRRSAR